VVNSHFQQHYAYDVVTTICRFSRTLLLIGCLFSSSWAWSKVCDGADRIALKQSVFVSHEARALLKSLPALRVVSVDAPPMASYNKKKGVHTGISVDILCFIAHELNLKLDFIHASNHTVQERINLIPEGAADIFMPLSLQPDRARHGLFTDAYFDNYYAIIGREHEDILIQGVEGLRPFHVGIVKGTSFSEMLDNLMPRGHLHLYDTSMGPRGLFAALRSGEIDVAVYNKSIFTEKRYQHDLFDLVAIDTLYEQPRAYRYYIKDTPQHKELVKLINRYLAVIDSTESVLAHQNGEQQFIERYVTQRSQRLIMFVIIGVGAVMLLGFYLMSRRYRRLTNLLERRNRHIQEQREALEQVNAELAVLTHTDDLTRLANRRFFNDTLQREHARWQRTQEPLSLLAADIDFFKLVNDHFGHQTGDDYLRAIARVLEGSVQRSTDLVARPGGEEFACLLPNTNVYDAQLIARRIQRGLAELALPNPLTEQPVLTISIGIATLISGNYSTESLIAHADEQLYKVKRTGRNNVFCVELTDGGARQPAQG